MSFAERLYGLAKNFVDTVLEKDLGFTLYLAAIFEAKGTRGWHKAGHTGSSGAGERITESFRYQVLI